MNKRVVSFVLSLVMILTMVPVTAMAASADQFTDVTKDKWYYSWINNVVEKDYFKGTSETKFSPNVAMTRGMFVTVLAKMEGVDLQAKTSAFGDVPVTKYYAGAAKWASENKIVSGYPDGTFKGESIVSREQMAVIMQNYINWRSAKTGEIHVTDGSKAKFADDAKISAYAKEAVYDCREWGLVDGYLDGTFCPQNGSTRAEVAAVISKLDWLVNGGGGGFTDPGNGKTEYTIKFDVDGSNFIEADEEQYTRKVEKDKTYTLLTTAAIKDGYEFLEKWIDTTDSNEYEAGKSMVATKSAMYSAKFGKCIEVTYVWNNDSQTETTEAAVETKTYTLPTSAGIKTGYNFTHQWVKDGDNALYAAGATVTAGAVDVTYTAQWSELYVISFDTDANGVIDATESALTITTEAGVEFNFPAAADEDGDIFLNKWRDDSNNVFAADKKMTVEGSMLYTACFYQPNDFIKNAMKESFDEFNTEYRYLINTDARGGSSVIVDLLNLNETIDANNARPQSVKAEATLTSTTVKEIVKMACGAVYTLCTDDQPEKPVVKEWVYAVIAAIEEETGVDIKKGTKEEICDQVWDLCVTRGQNFWAHFNNGVNGYYTGKVTLDVCGEKINLNINETENNLSVDVDGLWKDAATKAAIAMAKDLYGDLAKASNKNYVNSATLDATVTLKFSVPEEAVTLSAIDANNDVDMMLTTYQDHVEKYPLDYPITFTLKATCPEHVTYKTVAGEGAYVKLEVTENMQELYEEGVDYAVKKALESNTVKKQIEKLVDGSMTALKKTDVVKDLESALGKAGFGTPSSEVNRALNQWEVDNINMNDIRNSNMFEFIWEGTADFDNDAINSLINEIGASAANKALNKIKEGGISDAENVLMYVATPNNLEKMMAAAGVSLDFGVSEWADVKYYVYALVADKLNYNADKLAAEGTIADINAVKDKFEQVGMSYDNELLNLIDDFNIANEPDPRKYATETVKEKALAQIDGIIQPKIVAEVEGHEYYPYLQKALKAKDFDNLLLARLGNVAEILESEKLREKAYEEANKQIDKIESEEVKDKISKATEKFFENLVEYFEYVPEGATVIINGDTAHPLSKATVSALASAKDTDDILDVAVQLLREPALKDLRVIDCAPSTPDYDNNDGLKVEATWQEYSATGHLVIEVK